MSDERENLTRLLKDMLALETARELGLVKLPPDTQMNPIRVNTEIVANNLLSKYDETSLIREVKSIIIQDVRFELLKRTRLSQFIEWGLMISSFISAVIISAGQFVFTSPINVEAIHATYWIVLTLIVANFIGFAYLRYIDRGP